MSQWKEGSHDSYLWLRVNRGAAPNLFICMVYVAPIGSKHENKSLFQNLATDIVEVQILRGIVLLGRDFNAHTAALPNTIDTSNLCELLQAPELAKIKQLNIVVKRQNHNTSVGGWDRKLLDLCCDAGLLILNGWTPGDESRKFTCLANGGRNTVDHIVGSPIVWQATTHFNVIINDTHYYAMGGDSNHRLLRLRLSINYNFVEP